MIVFFASQIIPQALVMIRFQNPSNPEEQTNLLDYLYRFELRLYFLIQ